MPCSDACGSASEVVSINEITSTHIAVDLCDRAEEDQVADHAGQQKVPGTEIKLRWRGEHAERIWELRAHQHRPPEMHFSPVELPFIVEVRDELPSGRDTVSIP